ncbi:MAG: hypothetical protein LBQ63_02565 [Deltaproteobacteria bacterium]|jgi:hypothetical protein|nr:hypothetical protein [Deltaproteobacteria bacterium]
MRLCKDDTPLPDALEQLAAVASFLREALCGPRENPWQNDDGDMELWGAALVFEALKADLETARVLVIQRFTE